MAEAEAVERGMEFDGRAPIVHVGLQKTASSFLQQRVFSDAGAYVAPWGLQAAPAIEHFVLTHPAKFDPVAVRADFEKNLAEGDARRPIISHEDLLMNFFNGKFYPERAMRRIAQSFPNARIVIVIRRQESILLSMYYEYISQGGTKSFLDLCCPPYERIGFRSQFQIEYLEYDTLLDIAEKYLDTNNILMLPMELLKVDAVGFLSRIAEFSGVQIGPLASEAPVNERRRPLTMRAERLLNRILPTPHYLPSRYVDYPPRVRFKERLLRNLNRAEALLPKRLDLDGELARRIEELADGRFSRSNARTAEKTGFDLARLGYKV